MATRASLSVQEGSLSGSYEVDLSAKALVNSSEFWGKRDVGTTSQLGNTLSDRAEKTYVRTTALPTSVPNTSSNSMRAGYSIVFLLAGLTSFWTGDIVNGTIATRCGVKELWNLCSSGAPTDLQRLLNNQNAKIRQPNIRDIGPCLRQISEEIDGRQRLLNNQNAKIR